MQVMLVHQEQSAPQEQSEVPVLLVILEQEAPAGVHPETNRMEAPEVPAASAA